MHRLEGRAGPLHHRAWPSPACPSAWVIDVDRPALVLGSAQPAIDPPAEDLDVVRRRSGGGAVLVEPGGLLWVDVLVPAGDPRWDADVGRAFLWLGQVWVEALASVGVAGAARHDGSLLRSRWSGAACFAGLGPGEVTAAGRKLVGLSQRRTRAGALFQCAALLRWEPERLARLLGIPEAAPDLADVAAPVPAPRAALEAAFLAALARA